jgi:hypothetical protein
VEKGKLKSSGRIIAQVRSHQTLPKLPVVRHGKVKKLVHDDVIANGAIHVQQFGIEV